MVTHGLRPPIFNFVDGYFVVMLPGHDQAWATVRVAPGLLGKLDPQEQKIVDSVMIRGRIAASECAKELDVNVATARRYLRKLVDKGLLESRGSGPRLAYYLAGAE
jgi:predicted HTH transcriptional regulator